MKNQKNFLFEALPNRKYQHLKRDYANLSLDQNVSNPIINNP